MSVLNGEQIRELILSSNMIENYIDLDKQLQVHGFDVTLDRVYIPIGRLIMDFDNKELPEYVEELCYDDEYILTPGIYIVELTEVVNLPNDVCAIVLPRSTLVRSGIILHSALWDAGYKGKGKLLMYCTTTATIKRYSRIGQMVFFRLEESVDKGYSGSYQMEGIE